MAWRRDRLGRLWSGQLLGALLVWLAYYPLSWMQQAKERDDAYYFLRFQLAVCAAIGAWDLARRFLQVDLITTCFHAVEDEGLTVRIPLFEQLHRCGVRLTTHTRLQRIDGGAVVVSNGHHR